MPRPSRARSSGQLQCLEDHTNNNLGLRCGSILVSQDGTTVTATLLRAHQQVTNGPDVALRNPDAF